MHLPYGFASTLQYWMLAVKTQSSRPYWWGVLQPDDSSQRSFVYQVPSRRVPLPPCTISRQLSSSKTRSKDVIMRKLFNQDFQFVWGFSSSMCEQYFSCLSVLTIFFVELFISYLFIFSHTLSHMMFVIEILQHLQDSCYRISIIKKRIFFQRTKLIFPSYP